MPDDMRHAKQPHFEDRTHTGNVPREQVGTFGAELSGRYKDVIDLGLARPAQKGCNHQNVLHESLLTF